MTTSTSDKFRFLIINVNIYFLNAFKQRYNYVKRYFPIFYSMYRFNGNLQAKFLTYFFVVFECNVFNKRIYCKGPYKYILSELLLLLYNSFWPAKISDYFLMNFIWTYLSAIMLVRKKIAIVSHDSVRVFLVSYSLLLFFCT